MDIETRLKNLENLVDYLSKMVTNNKHYTDADIAGTRQSVTAITPYTETKTAYIGDTEVVFTNVPQGNLSVYFDTPTDYSVERTKDAIAVTFDALDEVTTVTISIQ
jgi:hypothetical protein